MQYSPVAEYCDTARGHSLVAVAGAHDVAVAATEAVAGKTRDAADCLGSVVEGDDGDAAAVVVVVAIAAAAVVMMMAVVVVVVARHVVAGVVVVAGARWTSTG